MTSIADFLSEIPNEDDFEEFAEAYLKAMGFEVVEQAARGPDQGKDLIVEEKLAGLMMPIDYRWLVSCKFIKGGSVGVYDEQDIVSRLQVHRCNGFIGFYSTRQSQGLENKLKGLTENSSRISPIHMFEYNFHRGSDIRQKLLENRLLDGATQGYLPKFYEIEVKPKRESDFAKGNIEEKV